MHKQGQPDVAIIDGKAGIVVDVTTGAEVMLEPVVRVIPINFDIAKSTFAVPADMKDEFPVGAGGTVYWIAPYPFTLQFTTVPPDTSKPSDREFVSKPVQLDPGNRRPAFHVASVVVAGHPPKTPLVYKAFVTVPPGVEVEVDPSIIIDTVLNRFEVRR